MLVWKTFREPQVETAFHRTIQNDTRDLDVAAVGPFPLKKSVEKNRIRADMDRKLRNILRRKISIWSSAITINASSFHSSMMRLSSNKPLRT